MLGDQANKLNGSYSKDQGVQVEGIKDSQSHTQICTNKMFIFRVDCVNWLVTMRDPIQIKTKSILVPGKDYTQSTA